MGILLRDLCVCVCGEGFCANGGKGVLGRHKVGGSFRPSPDFLPICWETESAWWPQPTESSEGLADSQCRGTPPGGSTTTKGANQGLLATTSPFCPRWLQQASLIERGVLSGQDGRDRHPKMDPGTLVREACQLPGALWPALRRGTSCLQVRSPWGSLGKPPPAGWGSGMGEGAHSPS